MSAPRSLTAAVRKYLRQRGYYQSLAKEFTKKVFLEALASYFKGKINAQFVGALADELLFTTLKKEGEIDLPLLHALTEASELDSAWRATRVDFLNHQLKFYLQESNSSAL